MVKKQNASLVPGKRVVKNVKPISDSQIDFSDIPESTDEELSRAKRVGRPRLNQTRKLIAIRLHPQLLSDLRKMAVRKSKPYQQLIHELLEQSVKKAA